MSYYLAQGYTEPKALAKTSMDLWHGGGCGRYIESAYNLIKLYY